MATIRNLNSRLQQAQPTEPRGWFRWLHDHFAGRRGLHDPGLEQKLAEQGWRELSQRFPNLSPKERAKLIPIFARHAWSVGRLELIELAESSWGRLGPSERGAILAGLSEADPRAELLDWLRQRLPDCTFSPESACQLACNAIWHEWSDVLSAVLNSGTDLSATIHRGDAWDYPKTRWPKILCKLSHRVIDMVLEAALVRNNQEAMQLALRAGAYPNIPVWRLERSFNEKHCALSFAISHDCRRTAEMLLEAGASAEGTDFTSYNYPLYQAVRKGWDDLARAFLKQGASLRLLEASRQHVVLPKTEGSESEIRIPFCDLFFGHFDEELNWARKAIGDLIELAPIEEKQAFYSGDGQGGKWGTILDVVVEDLVRLKLYEALGLDTRLTAEELCTAIDADAFDGLCYLLTKHGVVKRDRALFRIRHRKPDFGAVCRELELQPQSDGINNANEFNPAEQAALVLPDGTKLYVDLDAIAPPNHGHGPCLEGHFWLRVDKATYRRRKDRVIVTQFRTRWAMTKLPENRYQLDDLLPCIKEVNGHRIFLGNGIGKLYFTARDPEIQDRLHQWLESLEFQTVLDDAVRRIRSQDQANSRPKAPVLSEEELQGYPPIFWPHLIRLQTGFIGITSESCSDDPGVLDLYKVWARQNKIEDTFVPDPRLLVWEGWNEVPAEFRPFFEIDCLLGVPTVRYKANNDYERAMIHKAIMWKDAWITP